MSATLSKLSVPFLDLDEQNRRIAPAWKAALEGVTSRSQFILGPAVERFEAAFAEYVGVGHCVGLNNGTSALQLALHACDIGPGDEVITTPHTWISTTWAISYVGAKPVYVDIDPNTYMLNPALVERAITPRTKAILPVHLYGQACDLSRFVQLAEKTRSYAHRGCRPSSRRQAIRAAASARSAASAASASTPARISAHSAKPARSSPTTTAIAARIRRLRDHAQDGRHHHVEIGYNARMEGIQGAVLEVKLRYLDEWNAARRRHAARLTELARRYAGICNFRLPRIPTATFGISTSCCSTGSTGFALPTVGRARRCDGDPLPDPSPVSAGLRPPRLSSRRFPRGRQTSRAAACRCRCIPNFPTSSSSTSPSRSQTACKTDISASRQSKSHET